MLLKVCGASEIGRFVGSGFTHIISVGDWDESPERFRFPEIPKERHLHLRLKIEGDQILSCSETEESLVALFQWLGAQEVVGLVVHGKVGVFAAPAIAFLSLCVLIPNRKPYDHMVAVKGAAECPDIWPDRSLVTLGARLLGNSGEIVEGFEKWCSEAPESFVYDIDFGESTLEFHMRHPEVSIRKHRRSKVLENGDKVLSRTAIYLDTKYWVGLRDAELGRSDGAYCEILSRLRALVADGKAICPFGMDIHVEVLRQQDEQTRLATASLIDELSQAVVLQPEEERISTELMHCIQLRRKGEDRVEPLGRLVWTCPMHVFGWNYPISEAYDEQTNLAIQKSFLDSIWPMGFKTQAKLLSDQPEKVEEPWENMAEHLNELNKQHAGEMRSFKQVQFDEYTGMLETFLPALEAMVREMFFEETGSSEIDDESVARTARSFGGLFQQAFKRNKIGNHLPTIFIRSGLAAAIRWNPKRQYKPNDFLDFGHASSALPYFDLFATEKSLHHLLTQELKYDDKFSTSVFFKPEEFLAALEEL